MSSLYRLLIPDVIGALLMFLDLISDVAFALHLWRHEKTILFPICVTIMIISVIIVNIFAGASIEDLGAELQGPEWRRFGLGWVIRRDLLTRTILVVFGLFGSLPYVLVILHLWVACKNEKYGNDVTFIRLDEYFGKEGPSFAIKEIQSVLECGGMIYIKSFYLSFYALLYLNNWPVLLGLAFNVLSLFFGLRKDMVTVKRLKPAGFLIALINFNLRLTTTLLLAKATAPWIFFIPFGLSSALVFCWGAWLMADLPVFPQKLDILIQKARPTNVTENCITSLIYSLFLVPCNFHTAISLIPFFGSAIAIAFITDISLTLRIIMPIAGTVGLLPPVVWWTILKPSVSTGTQDDPVN